MIASTRRRGLFVVWMGAFALGFVLRALPLTAARPYIAYIDEGNFLHPAFRLLQKGGWDPEVYLYPQLPLVAVVAAARVVDPIYRSVRGRSLRDRIPAQLEVYDELEPFALLLIARCMSLALGLGIMALTGLLAMRLAGPRAGAAAALLAAVVPALVLRGPIATIDSYPTIFVLACLYLTDLTRTSTRAGLVSFLAGAMAGGAFASKYPAVVVIAAFGVTTLLQRIAWRERLRRLCLSGLGLAVGVALAMPVLVKHWRDVYNALLMQSGIYTEFVTAPLWKQAVLRAESNFPYERAELGFVFLALSLWGLVLGLRDRKIAATLWGWCAFAAPCFVLYGIQPFQPFRNLMPLVPLACVTVAILFIRIREKARRPPLVDGLAFAWVILAFVFPLTAYAIGRFRLEDPRKQAVDWLAARVRPEDQVLVVHELGFLHQEIERLRAKSTVPWWDNAAPDIRRIRPRFVVGGILRRRDGSRIDVAADPSVVADYELKLRVGKTPTVPDTAWWRGNDQLVYVLERKNGRAVP